MSVFVWRWVDGTGPISVQWFDPSSKAAKNSSSVWFLSLIFYIFQYFLLPVSHASLFTVSGSTHAQAVLFFYMHTVQGCGHVRLSESIVTVFPNVEPVCCQILLFCVFFHIMWCCSLLVLLPLHQETYCPFPFLFQLCECMLILMSGWMLQPMKGFWLLWVSCSLAAVPHCLFPPLYTVKPVDSSNKKPPKKRTLTITYTVFRVSLWILLLIIVISHLKI